MKVILWRYAESQEEAEKAARLLRAQVQAEGFLLLGESVGPEVVQSPQQAREASQALGRTVAVGETVYVAALRATSWWRREPW